MTNKATSPIHIGSNTAIDLAVSPRILQTVLEGEPIYLGDILGMPLTLRVEDAEKIRAAVRAQKQGDNVSGREL